MTRNHLDAGIPQGNGSPASPEQVKSASAELITLGTGGGNPSMTRNNTCTWLNTRNGAYLIDAGGPVSAAIRRKKLNFNSR